MARRSVRASRGARDVAVFWTEWQLADGGGDAAGSISSTNKVPALDGRREELGLTKAEMGFQLYA